MSIICTNLQMWKSAFTHEWLIFFESFAMKFKLKIMSFEELQTFQPANTLVIFVEIDKRFVKTYTQNNLNNKYIYWCDDLHHDKRVYDHEIFQLNIPFVSAFGNCFKNAFTSYHYALPFYNMPINLNPTRKILMSGAHWINDDIYGFRNFILKKAETDMRIHVLPHGKVYKEDYAKYINQFVCAITSTLNNKYHYLFAKIFEIPATGTLLLVEDEIKCELEQIGFIDMYNCVLINRSNFDSKIDFVLQNTELVDQMRRRGQELVQQKHLLENRLEEFNKIVNHILTKYDQLDNKLEFLNKI